MEFNNKLYELRKQKGFSQEELANRLNVSRQTVSKWEVGDSTPDMEKLIAISDLFGISLDELVLNKTPEPAPAPQPAKSELYTDIKEKVLTDENRKKAKKRLEDRRNNSGSISCNRPDIIRYICCPERISEVNTYPNR